MNYADFKKVLPYVLVVFFGYIGFSMPLPLLPKMFLDPQKSILPSFYSLEWKSLLLGFVMSAYPVGQLIGSPILGKCSDRWGRKKIILISLFGAMTGYGITALCVGIQSVLGIFLGLFLSGLSEGNVAIAQSVVADIASFEEKGKKAAYFGWINLFICLAFIIGPILGGQLSDSSSLSWFTFSTPFWIAMGMTLLGIFVVLRFSKETKKPTEEKIGFWKSFQEGLSQKTLCKMYLVNFFLAMGYFAFFRFFPVYLQSYFSFSSAMIGYAIAYGSVLFAIASIFLLKPVAKRLSPQRAVGLFAFLLAGAFFLVLWPTASWSFLWTSIPLHVSLAVVMTYATVLVSDASPSSFQGQAMGVLTSVQVLAETLTALGGGFLTGLAAGLPIMVGALMLIVASSILLLSKALESESTNSF
jgi:DHA1 family tetracycline resistance protein-like MFS transporter